MQAPSEDAYALLRSPPARSLPQLTVYTMPLAVVTDVLLEPGQVADDALVEAGTTTAPHTLLLLTPAVEELFR